MNNSEKTCLRMLFYTLCISMLFIACENAEESPVSGETGNVEVGNAEPGMTAPEAIVDLTVPPPGSQATQEKWDSFTDEKRQESWDKYLSSLSSDSSSDPASDSSSGDEKDSEETQDTSSKASQSSQPAGNTKPVAVVTAPLSTGPMVISYYGLGSVEAGQTSRISPAAAGTAARVFVSEGDFVEPGELLFSLDSSEWLRDIERTESKWETELTLAQIRLDEAAKEFERMQTFYQRDLVTREDLEKTQQNLTEAQLNMDKTRNSRETELEGLQDNYRGRLGTSPGRGYVSQLSFSEGETVNTSDFVEVINLENVMLSIEVPENIIPRINRGAPVSAKTATSARYAMEGEVTGHSVLPESNRTYQVRASLSNTNQRLLPGMLMEVQIELTRMQTRFIVPRQAVVTDGVDHFIFLVEDNLSRKVPVELGAGRQGFVQVEGDLTEGAILVIEGQSYLKQGSPVTMSETVEYMPGSTEL